MADALKDLLDAAKKRWDAMTSEQKEEMLRAQRESWVRAEMAMGSDADEARWKRENGF